MRQVQKSRITKETQIELILNLDGTGISKIDTGVKFFDHMLDLFTQHGQFDLEIKAEGDNVDNHHVIEDIGILLGQALYEALGEKRGIKRYSFCFVPMDESLARIVIDLSGRSYLVFDVNLDREYIGAFETEMLEEFFIAFTNNSKMNLHIKSEYGRNNHHIVEGIFKGLGQALKEAVKITDPSGKIPSTKGLLE